MFPKDNILSVSGIVLPFIEHNDGVRINMAQSQTRQAIALVSAEEPLIKTGMEDLYTKYSTYLYVAEKSGEVLFKGTSFFPYYVFRYDDGSVRFLYVGIREIDGFDTTLYVIKDVGERFEPGDVLLETLHFRDGKLSLGANLLTIFYTYKGWNFEDAIVVSRNGSKKLIARKYFTDRVELPNNKVLNSLDDVVYKPIYDFGSVVKQNQVIFRILNDNVTSLGELINNEEIIRANHSGRFFWYLYSNVNGKNLRFKPFGRFIERYYNMMQDHEQSLMRILLQYFSEYEVMSYFGNYFKSQLRGKYKLDGHKLNGTIIDYFIRYDEPLKLGSKLANRHGNKGVISKILDDNEILLSEKNEVIDLVFGPLGPVSRMNVGQLFEIHLNRATENFVTNILSKSKSRDEDLIDYISRIDNTDNHYYTQKSMEYLKSLNKEQKEEFYDEIFSNGLIIYQPPFQSVSYNQLDDVMKFTNTPYKEWVKLPNGKQVKVSIGKMYIYRLLHEPEKKMFARSLGNYDSMEQPVSGARNKGGHRLGEMETWTLVAYEAYNIIREYLNIKSDNPIERMRLVKFLMSNIQELYEPRNEETVSMSVFTDMLKSIGIDLEIK